MSFQELHQGKKRRVERACDMCRRKKSDGTQMRGDKCKTCLDGNLDCTYSEAPERPPTKNYVDSLEARLEQSEARLEHSEALVHQLRAELARVHLKISSNTSLPNSLPDTGKKTAEATVRAEGINGTDASMFIVRAELRDLAAPPPPPHADDLMHLELTRKFEKLKVGSTLEQPFMGKSSGAVLLKVAIDLKENVTWKERERALVLGRHSREQSREDVSVEGESGENGVGPLTWSSRRLQYWHYRPLGNTAHHTHAYMFPSEARMSQFIELYFTHQNMYMPLLHRPTFERNIAEGLHLRNDGFASTVLLVCAIASRWSTELTVMTGVDLACGWEWFDQVPLGGNHLFGQTTLYDLQYYCLAVQFLDGSSAPQACWTLIGVGLRLAQDIGCHRRSARIEVASVERELYKRAFWVLVYLDRNLSSTMGRTCAIQYHDFDIDLPLECDDEYWEHPTHPFQQPAGVPSRVTFFSTLIGLYHILALSLKILYGLNKTRALFMTDAWEETAVAELDSALNDWRDRVPEHLRWESTRQDSVFFDQSVALHCSYYHLQILIHRPFIPMLRKSAPTALPSLAICTSAARAITGMVDVQSRRKGNVPVFINLPPVFIAGIILLLNVLSGKRTRLVPDSNREMANVHKCMKVARLCEHRWQSAGLIWDILAELASVGQLPLPNLNGSSPAGADSHIHQPSDVNGNGSPEHDPQFRAPYAPVSQPSSFAGGVGGDAETFGPSPTGPSAFTPTPAPETWFPPEDSYAPYTTDPTQASRELGDMMHLIDSDMIAMWRNAPMGLEVDDWGNYVSNFSELKQGQQAAHADTQDSSSLCTILTVDP
ncbi:fungal-specific transcription factor domain-containing protein [Mycena capillaripes]|nr:fungal-specific transcription factor domain-containing protein [Mycena capillaripes]